MFQKNKLVLNKASSIKHSVDDPPPLVVSGVEEGVEPPTKFSKREGLTGPKL